MCEKTFPENKYLCGHCKSLGPKVVPCKDVSLCGSCQDRWRWGAVRVNSVPVMNVVTGPKQGTGFVIVVIPSGETYRLYGQPSVRYFRRRNL